MTSLAWVAGHADVPPRLLAAATAGAVAVGALYTASPSAIWFAVVAAALLRWAGAGLPLRERRWVVATLGVALAARVAVIALLPWLADPSRQTFRVLLPDAHYMIRRSLWIRHFFADAAVAPRDLFEAFYAGYADTNYYYVLAFLQILVGPAPYGAHLLSVACYLAAAVLLYRHARAAFGPAAAFAGLVPVLFLPTLFLWSLSPLKEAAFFLLLAAAVVLALRALAGASIAGRVAAAAGAALAAVMLDGLRPGGWALAAGGVGVGGLLWACRRRPALAGALALVAVPALVAAFALPAVHDWVLAQINLAMSRHVGHVYTAGHAYTLLDPQEYRVWPGGWPDLSLERGARFLAAAVVRFFTVPEPWNVRSALEVALLPQHMVWLALVGLLFPGVWIALRRGPAFAALLTGVVAVGVAAVATNSGNVGTLIRHRDTMAPLLFWLSGVGAVWAVAAVPRERPRFRQVNAIDAGALLLVAGLVPAGYAAYALLRTPAPEISGLEPATWAAGEPRRVTLHGQHLRPFLRAYFVPAGQPLELLDGHEPPPSAPFLLRAVDRAELEMPALGPGSYDLALFEFSDEVARKADAFRVVDQAPAPPRAAVDIRGAFLLGAAETGDDIAAGSRWTAGGTDEALEVVARAARHPEYIEFQNTYGPVSVAVANRWRVPAALRATCAVVDRGCQIGAARLTPGAVVPLVASRATRDFLVTAVDPVRGALPAATLTLRVVARAEVIALVRVGDDDAGPDQPLAANDAARVAARGAGRFAAGETGEPLVAVDLTLHVPVVRARDGWSYRGQVLRAGERLTFETPRYVLHGSVVRVAVPEAAGS